MKRMRFLAFLLALTVAFGMLSPIVLAEDELCYIKMENPDRFLTSYSTDPLESYVNLEKFSEMLSEQMEVNTPEIDLSRYWLPATQEIVNALSTLLYYELPLMFHFHDFEVYYSRTSGFITHLEMIYKCDSAKYQRLRAECLASADRLLSGIKGNTALSDLKKGAAAP